MSDDDASVVDDTAPIVPQLTAAELFATRLGHLVAVPTGKQPTNRGLVDRLTTLEPQE